MAVPDVTLDNAPASLTLLQTATKVAVEVIAPSPTTDIIASAVIVDVALAVALPRWTSSATDAIDDALATNASASRTLVAEAVTEAVAVTTVCKSSIPY